MAPSPSRDALAAAVGRLSGCRDQVTNYTGRHAYALDCLVRHLLDTGWSGALALGLPADRPELVIAAGIGVLTLTPTTTDFRPAVPATAAQRNANPAPLPAPPDLAEARLRVCQTCPRYVDARCSIAGCNCAGQGQPTRLLSVCPLGSWPQSAMT